MILYLSTRWYVPGCTKYILQVTIPDAAIMICCCSVTGAHQELEARPLVLAVLVRNGRG
jgi:hypothetical protein